MSITNLISWSLKEFSSLPWRKERSLYRTLVSEIMLQQTTVSTVKNHYERFLREFPDLNSLAQASEDELLVAWKGLGYYRRAKNLKKIAEAIVNDHKGKFPTDLAELQLIPGIGPYTANAIIAIGMDRPALALDANLERVIARLYGLKERKGPILQKKIQELFRKNKIFQGAVSSRSLNEALMDLGRTYCQARKVSCELCLLRQQCLAFKEGSSLKLPLENDVAKKTQIHELHLLRIYVMKGKKLLVYRKDESEWLSGQYEVPSFIVHTTDEEIGQYQRINNFKTFEKNIAGTFKTSITKYKITNLVLKANEEVIKKLKFNKKCEWRGIDSTKANLSTATHKGLKYLSAIESALIIER